jgi:hypothetical protein
MWRFWREILVVVIALLTLASAAWGQVAVPAMPPPLAPGVAPAWTVVPASPKVLYAPNVPGDVFRLHRQYYYYHRGYWYRSKHLTGPWHPVRKLPQAILRVNRSCFKSPPPW